MTGLPNHIDKWVSPEPNTGCWIWLGALGKDNYGIHSDHATQTTMGAHRRVYQILVGPIPKGQCALHRCDNPWCVNPEHIFLGTKGDNNRDRHSKRRSAIGERHGMSKLTAEQVLQIRRARGLQKDTARQFGVSLMTVKAIKQRRLWKHLKEELSHG
jgi:hypothetical protein